MKNKWVLLAFLCGLFLVYNIDRGILGVLAIPIQEEFGLTDVQFGCLSSGVFWTYALMAPLAGFAGNRFDKRMLLGITSVLWSLMTILAGFSCGFWSLFLLVSVALVAPQTCFFPTANALISECHDDTRTRALSFLMSSSHIGWLASGIAVAGILSLFGSWRWAYFIFGGAGLVLALVFLAGNRKAGSSAAGAKAADGGGGKPSFAESLKAFFACPAALLVATSYVMMVFVGYGYVAWGPKFIAKKFAISPAAAGSGVMFCNFAAAFVAIIAAGWITDRYVKGRPRFRLFFMIGTLLVAAPMMVLFAFGQTLAAVWAGAVVFGLARGAYEANPVAALFDVVELRYRAGAVAFMNVMAAVVGSLAPVTLGALSQRYGMRGFELGFAGLGCTFVIAIAALAVAANTGAWPRRAGIQGGKDGAACGTAGGSRCRSPERE